MTVFEPSHDDNLSKKGGSRKEDEMILDVGKKVVPNDKPYFLILKTIQARAR
jgi:hypothetical protein